MPAAIVLAIVLAVAIAFAVESAEAAMTLVCLFRDDRLLIKEGAHQLNIILVEICLSFISVI